MPKIICFDLRPLQTGHQNRGIGMVIKSVLENLEDKENRYIFYIFDKNNPIDDLGIKLKIKKYEFIKTKTLKTELKKPIDILDILKLIFHRYRKLRPCAPNIFMQFDFTLGFPRWRKTKIVVMAHDLIPLLMRREYLPSISCVWNNTIGKKNKLKSTLRAIYYNFKYKIYYSNLKKAHSIVSISKSTTNSLINLLKIDKKRITTIYEAPALSKVTSNINSSTLLNRFKKPYIVYIGGTDRRKHIDHIVYSYNIVRSRGFDLLLLLVGSEFKDLLNIPDTITRDAILSSPYQKDIHLLGFISDTEKNLLYQNAHALVFCSTLEGFGLPLIEAEANSCPIVAYNNSSIPEVVADPKFLSESGNYVDIAKKIILLFDTENRMTQIKKGLVHSRNFSWNKFLYELMKIFNS